MMYLSEMYVSIKKAVVVEESFSATHVQEKSFYVGVFGKHLSYRCVCL